MKEKINQARHLYMNEARSQKEIAEIVGVSERTIHTWIKRYAWEKLKLAASHAPALIADNIYCQLAELQYAIAQREPGKRYPTMDEAEVTRKLVLCTERLKKYPSLAQNMQMIETFKSFVRQTDKKAAGTIASYGASYLEHKGVNGFKPYEMDYMIDELSLLSPFCDEETEEEKLLREEEENQKEEEEKRKRRSYGLTQSEALLEEVKYTAWLQLEKMLEGNTGSEIDIQKISQMQEKWKNYLETIGSKGVGQLPVATENRKQPEDNDENVGAQNFAPRDMMASPQTMASPDTMASHETMAINKNGIETQCHSEPSRTIAPQEMLAENDTRSLGVPAKERAQLRGEAMLSFARPPLAQKRTEKQRQTILKMKKFYDKKSEARNKGRNAA